MLISQGKIQSRLSFGIYSIILGFIFISRVVQDQLSYSFFVITTFLAGSFFSLPQRFVDTTSIVLFHVQSRYYTNLFLIDFISKNFLQILYNKTTLTLSILIVHVRKVIEWANKNSDQLLESLKL